MNRIVHFEIHATEPEKLAAFYASAFGWDIKEWVMTPPAAPENRYWLVTTGKDEARAEWPGINGGMVVRHGEKPKGGEPVNAYVCTISVENIDATIEKIKSAGGTEATSKMPIPNVGMLAYYKDTEGNLFGILQPTPPKQS